MSARAWTCPRCGAPLPLAGAGAPFLSCAFCDATLQRADAELRLAEPKPAVVSDTWGERRVRFVQALQAALSAGRPPYDALCAAARDELGPLGQTDGLARVTLALAADFDREHGTSVTTDPTALSRIAEEYHRACGRLAETERTELNLPFLQATPRGPVHLLRPVTAAAIATLAARSPDGRARAPDAAPPPPAPKKRGWWPFG